MKKLQSLTFLATLAIALGMISWGSALHAQQTPQSSPDTQQPQSQQPPTPETPPSSQQTPQSQTPSQQQPDTTAPQSQQGAAGAAGAASDTQTFSGTVVKQGDKYMLKDDSGKMYDIDHQPEVAKFDGKRVRVQGTLDSSGKKIMVK